MLRVRVCGGLEVEADGRPLPDALVGGRQGRLVLAYLVCHRGRAVHREELAELLWADRLPDTWSASLSAVISRLRRLLIEAGLDGGEALRSAAGSYQLVLPGDTVVDLDELVAAVDEAEAAAAAGEVDEAVRAALRAESIAAGGFLREDCEWVDRQREAVRDLRVRATLARSAAHLDARANARAVDAARDALALDESREASYRMLMRALAAAGERGEALRVWERCRTTLVDELGIDPSAETEAVYLEVLGASAASAPTATTLPSGVVTFLLTDIVASSSLWDHAPAAMAIALERHDELVAAIVAAHGGVLLKSKLEGDATVSVFARASDGALAALALHEALAREPWPGDAVLRLRMAMHTGEAFERGGDYFGPALNRAARLRSLAGAEQILLSQAATELVRDHLPDSSLLRDLGHLELRGLSRGENVFELCRAGSAAMRDAPPVGADGFMPPPLPAALVGAGPFVGRGHELGQLRDAWDGVHGSATRAVFIGGEPGVGKSRLAAEIAGAAHGAGALVLYGRCDEDLAAPLQPFIEAVRSLVPAFGSTRLRAVRGIDELRRFVPELGDLLPDRSPAVRADPDTERLALFDAVTQLLVAASYEAPLLLVLDDLHWAGKTTLSLLRHLLRGATDAPLLVIGTYRDTELARTHPLAATLADLRRDTHVHRIGLGGLAAEDVEAYLAAIGNTDRALGRELAEVTSGNPFFLIEVVRHVEESGGAWERGSLPEGVREATGRRLSRLSQGTNDALAVAAVVGASFDLALVEQVCGQELIDEVAEACHAGLVVEEPGALDHFRFAHALVRQVLLAELVTLKRVRLHRAIAEVLDAAPPSVDPDARLADLAYHWFECASMGGADKAVEACRRAADRATERLAYEEAGDLYGMAIQALDAAETADREIVAALHLARCDALLTAGDVAGARAAIDALELEASGSERLAAWFSTFEGLLAVLAEPDRLTEIVQSIGAAAGAMRAVGDLTGEAKAHYVHAMALERLGQIGSAERALDSALAAARAVGDRRLADAILAEAPPAALWGPRPVTRASGSCLDVVRVLRITDGAPAVESVALRCQAVLEALRGRMEAARKMIGSARRTVERLGLTHRRLETEVAAGFIELLDGKAAEAEVHLRDAYDGLRTRGLEGEAAQAAAFLGRALLLQDRIDEADAVAAEAEALAGADLKAAIAWRDVRAEAAARRGDLDRALSLAREAVELATATDALLLVADARLSLATVLRRAGDHEGADAEARRAVEACEAKGATVLAGRARAALSVPEVAIVSASTRSPALDSGSPEAAPADDPLENDACRVGRRVLAAYNGRDWDGLLECIGPGWEQDDRRSVVRVPLNRDQSLAGVRLIFDGGARFRRENLATRGRTLALCRWVLSLPEQQAVFPVLSVTAIGDDDRYSYTTLFDADDLDGAISELDAMFLAGEGAEHAPVLRVVSSLLAALEAHDADTIRALLDPACRVRTTWQRPEVTGDEWVAELAAAFEVWGPGRVAVLHIPRLSATRGVWVLEAKVQGADGGGPVQGRWVFAVHAHDGKVQRLDFYQEDELHAALDAFDGVGETTLEGADHPFANEAWRAALRMNDRCNRRDWQGFLATLAPGFEIHDNRTGVHLHTQGEEALDTFRFIFGMNDWTSTRELLATRDDRLALVRDDLSFVSGDAGPAELSMLNIVGCDEEGRVTANIAFGADELRKAYDELDAQQVALGGPDVRVYREAFKEVAHDFVPGAEIWMDHVITRPPATLTAVRYTGTRDGGTFERPVIAVSTSDEAGHVLAARLFDIDDVEQAYDELDRLAGVAPNAASRAASAMAAASCLRDLEALRALHDPAFRFTDNRAGTPVPYGSFDDVYTILAELNECSYQRHLLATRGERLAVVQSVIRFTSGSAGPSEVVCLNLIEVNQAGALVHDTSFDVDDKANALDALDTRARELEVAAEVPSPNAASRAVAAMDAAANARDWDAFRAVLSPRFERHDNRAVLGVLTAENDPIATWRALFELDDAGMDNVLLATRGDRLALTRLLAWFRSGDAGTAEVESIHIIQVDDRGAVTHEISFDAHDLEAARRELDIRARRLEEETDTRPSNAAWLAVTAMEAAINNGDWDAFTAVYAPGLERSDRRRVLGTFIEPDDRLAAWPTLFELDEAGVEAALVATRGERLVLARLRVSFCSGSSGLAEVEILDIVQVDQSGLVTHEIAFDVEDLDAALEALDSRARALDGETQFPFPSAAWDAVRAMDAAVNARDWDAFTAVLAPGFEDHDRRSMVGVVTTGEQAVLSYRWLFELDEAHLQHRLLATRGEQLALVRTLLLVRSGKIGISEVECLQVTQVDGSGRITHEVAFDLDDMDAALDELDARYTALGGYDGKGLRRSFDARDWDAFASRFHPNCRMGDGRTAGFGLIDIPTFIEFERSLVELSPDCRLWPEHTRTRGDVHFAYVRTFGTRDGGPWDLAMWTVSVIDAAGLCVALENFELSELDAALARFEELVAQQPAPRPNRAWESVLAAYEAFDRRDWDGFVRQHLPAQVHDHRQRGTAHVLVGEDAFRSARVMWDMDEARLERQLVATEGDRVALVENQMQGSDGAVGDIEVVVLVVIEIAEDGRISRQTSFDPEDLEDALGYLHEQAEALAPVPTAASRLVAAQDDAFARRDWETFSGSYGQGFRVDDRRRTIARLFDEEQSVATLRYAFDIPGLEWHRTLVATRGDALALVRDEITSSRGTSETHFESSSLTLVELDADGRCGRHTVFDVENLSAAITELDARAAALRLLQSHGEALGTAL